MKHLNHLFIFAGSLFVGVLKGQEARSQWKNKMKTKLGSQRLKLENDSEEVHLDDFEIASFHKN